MAKTMKLFWVVVIIAMVFARMADSIEPQPEPDCTEMETCVDDEDCQAIHDDSYCHEQGACGNNENGEPLGYCYRYCDEPCIDDNDCQEFHDDSYCYHQEIAYCGTDENGEDLGYCYGIDACSEYPLCYVLGDCPADDGNIYHDCCDVGMCLPDKKGFCC